MRALLFCLLLPLPSLGARYVATSPQTAELLFQLGLGDEVVGVSAGSVYPPEAAKRPSVGQLFAPSLEKTLALNPTRVILDAHNLNAAFATALRSFGLAVFVWDTLSPDALLRDGEQFLKEEGRPSGIATLRQWRACLAALPAQGNGERILGFVWLDPPILLGPSAFLSRLLENAGYRNAFDRPFHTPYVPVTEEWLMAHPVERVFHLPMPGERPETARSRFARWWPTHPPPISTLDADLFARASLTPLLNLNQLVTAPPKECHAAR